MSRSGRLTPAAPADRATSHRELTRTGSLDRATRVRASRSSSRVSRPGARSWISVARGSATQAPGGGRDDRHRDRPAQCGREMPSVGELGLASSRLGIRPARYALRPDFDPAPDRFRHQRGVLRKRDGRVDQHCGCTELHRQRGVRRSADAGIDDDRHAGLLDDDAHLLQRLEALAGPDRRPERHDRDGADLLQLLREHWVGIDVGEDLEALTHEHPRGHQRLLGVGKQVARVGDHLELDPVGKSHRAGEACDPDRLLGRAAARSVGQDAELLPVDHVEDGSLLGVVQVEAAQGNRHQLATRRAQGSHHLLVVPVLAGP